MRNDKRSERGGPKTRRQTAIRRNESQIYCWAIARDSEGQEHHFTIYPAGESFRICAGKEFNHYRHLAPSNCKLREKDIRAEIATAFKNILERDITFKYPHEEGFYR
jgi:hypothetical protein